MATEKSTSKTETKKKTAATSAKKPASSSAKKPAAAKKPASGTAKKTTGTSVKVTATEKKLLELYRAADSATKKEAMAILKGEKLEASGVLEALMDNKDIMNAVTNLFKG